MRSAPITTATLKSLLAAFSGPAAWGAVVIEVVLTGGFLYCFVTEPRQAPDKALS